jgi:hypothetical protein
MAESTLGLLSHHHKGNAPPIQGGRPGTLAITPRYGVLRRYEGGRLWEMRCTALRCRTARGPSLASPAATRYSERDIEPAASPMGSAHPDPFEQFVANHGLRITTEELAAYPRDVLAAPAELDRHVLVTLVSGASDRAPVHSLFVVAPDDTRPASTRDVMWWLSADSWAYERAGHDLDRWAASYGYPADDPTTMWLMQLHARQARALSTLMGSEAYANLLQLYENELGRNG